MKNQKIVSFNIRLVLTLLFTKLALGTVSLTGGVEAASKWVEKGFDNIISTSGLSETVGGPSAMATPPAFTPGNLVVLRAGTGAAVLSNTATAAFLDEYTTSGQLIQSISLPTSDSGSNQTLTVQGSASNDGNIGLSDDKRYILIPGYDAIPGAPTPASSAASSVNRVIGRVDMAGNVDTSTAMSGVTSGNLRSVASVDGTAFWTVGSAVGVVYTTFGAVSATPTVVSNTVTNNRWISVQSGQLYVSGGSGTVTRLGSVGTGTPTSTGQTIVSLPGLPATNTVNAFFFADLSPSVPGVDTAYFADDASTPNGIYKYSLSGGTWTSNGSVTLTGARGLSGSVSGSSVTLFVTTGTSGTAVSTFTDSSGHNAVITGTASTVATAPTNTAFRGVVVVPTPTSTPAPTPDTTITSKPTDPTNSTSAGFEFSSDVSGATFECKMDSGSYESCTSPKYYTGLSDGSHTFSVRASAAGLTDGTPASATWTVDTSPPDTSIDTKPVTPTSTLSATFTFSGAGTGGSYQCSINSGTATTCTSPLTFNATANASNTISITAVDDAGNSDPTPATYTWVHDNIAPATPTITSTVPSYTNSRSISISFTATDGGSGVASYECSVDSGVFSACTSPKSLSGLSDGLHTFSVKAKDAVSNVSGASTPVSWTVDLVAPTINAYTPLASTTSTGPQTLTVTSSDADVDKVELSYTVAAGFAPTEDVTFAQMSPVVCSVSSPGTYACEIPGQSTGSAVTYWLKITDFAGNYSENPDVSSPNVFSVGAARIPSGTYSALSMGLGTTLRAGMTNVNGVLTLTGAVDLGNAGITLGCNATVVGASSTNYIDGALYKRFCANGSFTYPVGTVPDVGNNLAAVGEYTPVTATVSPLTPGSLLGVTPFGTTLTGANPAKALARHWELTEIGDVAADLTFSYLDGDVVGDESSYVVLKRSGTATVIYSGGTVNTTANTFSVSGVTDFSGWTAGALAPTSAGVEISGRVISTEGLGLRGVKVMIFGGGMAEPKIIKSNSFGSFRFEGLPVGETYVIQVLSGRHIFRNPSKVIYLFENLANENFVAEPMR